MRATRLLASALVIGGAAVLSGCIQWGDYAEGAECEPILDDFATAINEVLELSWESDSFVLHPQEYKVPWCSEWAETGLSLAVDDPRRLELSDRVAEIVGSQRAGVVMSIEYAAGDADTFASPDTPMVSTEP